MKERDPLALHADSRNLVYQPDTGFPAPLQRCVEIVHREADMMDPGSTAGDEFPDRRVLSVRLEQLEQRLARLERADPRAVGIRYFGLVHSEDLPVERHRLGDRGESDANVGNPGPLWGLMLH